MNTFFERFTYLGWLTQVDLALSDRAGVSRDDLSDVNWVGYFHDEVEPDEAALDALEEDGFPIDEGWIDDDEEWIEAMAEWDDMLDDESE
jgi:hypothetical protein